MSISSDFLFDFGWINPFRRYSRSKPDVVWNDIAPNLAFWLPYFFLGGEEGRPPNFGTWIIKLNTLPITWQSFTSIGRGSSKISRRKEKKRQQ